MKGIVNTIEAAIGTVVLLVLVTIAFGSQISQQDGASSYNDVQAQLERLQETGKLEEYVSDRDASGLKSEIDALPAILNVSIEYENVTRGSNSSDNFSADFSFSSSQKSPFLLLWGEGGQIVADINGEQVYDGSERFTLVEISSEVQTGSNTLEIDNPSEQRIGYSITRRSEYGSTGIEGEDVRVIRRTVIPEEIGDIGEVRVYLR